MRQEGPVLCPDATALVAEDERLTYAQLDELAARIAAPVPARSVVFLVATNSIEAIAAYAGFLRRRAVVVMIRPECTADQFASLAGAYAPQFIWLPTALMPSLARPEWERALDDRAYCLMRTGEPAYPVHDDVALLLTTSGSTGTPKFVRLSYANLRANAESIAKYQRLTPADRAITTLPFSYTYGISIVNSHLLAGASVVVTEEGLMSRGFWDLLKRESATNFGGVPYTYEMLERLRFGRMDVPSLRFISQAGGRLGERLQGVFAGICAEKGIELFVMYGQTEATARMSWLPPKDAGAKLGSIGMAIPGGAFELIGADGVPIEAADKPGELVYRGKNVSLGYATGKDDLLLGDENGGVLHTGDIARRDADGYYYVVGRMKRFLKMFGNRVNMDELEAGFAKRGTSIACVGSDDHMVVFAAGADPESVLQDLVAETGLHPRGFDVRAIGEIPHTASGKVDYRELERRC